MGRENLTPQHSNFCLPGKPFNMARFGAADGLSLSMMQNDSPAPGNGFVEPCSVKWTSPSSSIPQVNSIPEAVLKKSAQTVLEGTE